VLGIHEFDAKVTDNSPQAAARRKAHVKERIAELSKFDPAKLSTQDRISRDIALEEAALEARENAMYGDLPFGSEDPWLAVSSMTGPQLSVGYIVNAVAAWMLFGESLTVQKLVGIGFIVIGVFLVARS
jgi:uncharacterized protein (DUF885 family)